MKVINRGLKCSVTGEATVYGEATQRPVVRRSQTWEGREKRISKGNKRS